MHRNYNNLVTVRRTVIVFVCAILLSSCAGEVTVPAATTPESAASAEAEETEPTAAPTPTPATEPSADAPEQTLQQVLVVSTQLPKNMSVSELLERPVAFLSPRALPRDEVSADAIHTIADLQELEGMVVASDVVPGEQLVRSNFRDPNAFRDPDDFSSSESTSGEPELTTDEPGMRQVLVAIITIPRYTSARELAATPTTYLTTQTVRSDDVTDSALESFADLSELEGLIVSADVRPGEQLIRSDFSGPSGFPTSESSDGNTTFVESPGHELAVLVLPPERAAVGHITPGQLVRVVATSTDPDGETTSTTLLKSVEVLNAERSLKTDAPTDISITLALDSNEAAALAEALDESAVLTVALPSQVPDE